VTLRVPLRAPLVAAWRVLAHGFRASLGSSPFSGAFRFERGLNVP
jgi:hypothetical protein